MKGSERSGREDERATDDAAHPVNCPLAPRREHGFPEAHPDPGALFPWLAPYWLRPWVTRAEWWEKGGGALPQSLSALVVSGGRGVPFKARLPSRPRPRPGCRAESCPRGRWRSGRGRGRVGVELSEGEWVLFAWAYPPLRAAQTTSATAFSAPSRSPRGELTPGALGD